MIAIVLALFSAAVSGVAVVLVGRHSGETNALNISMLISLTGLIVVLPFAVVFTDFSTANLAGILLFAAGGILTPGLVRLFYYSGLKKLGPSVNSTVFSVYPIYSSLFAVFFLSELLTLGNWIGVAAIASGVVLIELSCRENACANSVLKDWILPILGGLTLGISAILRKAALNVFNAPLLGVAVAYCFAFIPYFFFLAFDETARSKLSPRRHLKLFWLAGIGQAISWILSFYALSLEAVAIVVPLLSIEPLFVAAFAFIYLRKQERLSPKLVASIIVTLLGLVLVLT